LQAAAEALLAALQRGARAKPGLFEVMILHIGRAPCDEFGELAPADLGHSEEQVLTTSRVEGVTET
jgi:hypothetical protein